jgi:O-antigen biosynthesis protein WbqP
VYANFLKRGVDALFAALLLILTSPVMLLVALAIRIADPGPALFRQTRAGRANAPFTIYKFRSMPVATPNVPSAAAGQLPVTPVGRLIRRTNLDELPQLYNILRGDMSFIGPRPALPAQTALLALRNARGIMRVRPGLTGLAQVNAYDGMPETEKVEWERRYVENISLVGDLMILLRTVRYVMRPPPVY